MFHFFCDVDLLESQLASDAFGAVSTATFRVTSVHRATGTAAPKAYAVCGGEVLVQDAGSGLVNLVLKPSEQPPFAFPRIKFFIYRGIVKSSLVAGNDVALASNNDLTGAIWDAQAKRNAHAQTSATASSKALGIDVSGNGSIDEVFYQTNQPHQLQHVEPGWSVGLFSTSQFGFEIVVDSAGFDPPLSMARLATNLIAPAAPQTGATAAQLFAYRTAKEEVLNYIDPCAFFGSFLRRGLRVKTSTGSFTAKPPYGVYDTVLKGAHLTGLADGVFHTRNTTYVDIRNEYAHSLDYFGNYGGDVYVAFGTQGVPAAQNYYDSGWPVMTIANGDLPPGLTASRIVFRLALPGGDNPFPTLFLSAGYLRSEFPREAKARARLIDLKVASGRTDEVALAIPNRGGTTATTAVSSYIRLKYFKRFDLAAAAPPQSSGTVIRGRNFLDDVFAPFDFKIPFSGPGKIKSMIYDSEVFIDMTRSGGFDEIASVGVLDDGTNYTFMFHPKIVRTTNRQITVITPFSGEMSRVNGDPWLQIAEQLDGHVAVNSTLQVGSQPPIPYVAIVDEGSSEVDEPYFGITLVTCNKAQLLATDRSGFASWSPLYLGAHNMVRFADALGREYWNFNISLIGFDNAANPSVKEVVTGITIYLYGDLTRRDVILVGTDGSLALQSTGQIVPPVPPVKHIFVLMLENRSFDHMLGFSGLTGIDAETGQGTAIEGASNTNFNLTPVTAVDVHEDSLADFVIPPADAGPPHEFDDVLRQLCTSILPGGVAADHLYYANAGPRPYPPITSKGFIYSYKTGSLGPNGTEPGSNNAAKIMRCFHPDQVPVITELARQFAVCDRWYSSLPGPTWPNRFFVHAATSGGLDDSPSTFAMTRSEMAKGYRFDNGSIYDRVDARSASLWRIYQGDFESFDTDTLGWIPQSLALEGMTWGRFASNFRAMPLFAADLAKDEYLPLYTFIEPDYGNIVGDYSGGTSQHPLDDVRAGESLIKYVYESIRNSSHWQNSVLVITYDEHGGFYDHVAPPSATPPGDMRRHGTPHDFDFGWLGPRVPAVIVSPLIPKGTIDHTKYSHASILATLERAFNIPPMTETDRNANDFRHLLSLLIPRMLQTEAPAQLSDPPASFGSALGPTTYRHAPLPPPLPSPPSPILIDSPIRRPRQPFEEDDLEVLLAQNSTWQVPQALLGDHNGDLPAWLHVAFRCRLATHKETDAVWRHDVLQEYCAITTVTQAHTFIEQAVQETKDFRATVDPTQTPGDFLG